MVAAIEKWVVIERPRSKPSFIIRSNTDQYSIKVGNNGEDHIAVVLRRIQSFPTGDEKD